MLYFFLGILGVFLIFNLHLIARQVRNFLCGESSFVEFRDELQSELKSDDFFLKDQYINLNGLYARMIGQRVINDVVLARDNMLLFLDAPALNMIPIASEMACFGEVLEQMGIPFLYIQMPSKVDLKEEILLDGIENHYNSNADVLLSTMERRAIRTLDLRPKISATLEDVKSNFYRTDHHWNYGGAFKAYPIIVQEIQNILHDDVDLMLYLDQENWQVHRMPKCYLGSQGKRIGVYAVGMDDFEYYTPMFETDISVEIPSEASFYSGPFEESIVRKERLINMEDYFHVNPYRVYIGEDYLLTYLRNEKAPVDKKVLILKDSFSIPILGYLSTIYKEIDVIDPRYYQALPLAKYAYFEKPDIVCMMINPSEFEEAAEFNYGYQEYAGNSDDR